MYPDDRGVMIFCLFVVVVLFCFVLKLFCFVLFCFVFVFLSADIFQPSENTLVDPTHLCSGEFKSQQCQQLLTAP